VDVQVNVHIPPVLYHFFIKIPHREEACARAANGLGDGCENHPFDPNWRTVVNVWYECEEHTQSYADRLASAQVSISLTRESRLWILTDLAQAYPGAHLIHPDFSFSYSGGGASWSKLIPNIQTIPRFPSCLEWARRATPCSDARAIRKPASPPMFMATHSLDRRMLLLRRSRRSSHQLQ